MHVHEKQALLAEKCDGEQHVLFYATSTMKNLNNNKLRSKKVRTIENFRMAVMGLESICYLQIIIIIFSH